MKNFILAICAVLLSVTTAFAQEQFKFQITTTAANETFNIPVSGSDGSKAYNWKIVWGDGSATQTASGTGSSTHAGIPHKYAKAGTYEITITPAGSNDAWFAAFGFYGSATGANAQANRNG